MSTPTKADANPVYRLAFSIRELAEMLGVNYYTVRRKIADGSIGSFQIGGEFRIPLQAVATILGCSAAELNRIFVEIHASAGAE